MEADWQLFPEDDEGSKDDDPDQLKGTSLKSRSATEEDSTRRRGV